MNKRHRRFGRSSFIRTDRVSRPGSLPARQRGPRKNGLKMVAIGLGAAAIGFLIGRLFNATGA